MNKKPSYEISENEMALISQYWLNELSDEQRKLFEQQMNEEPVFRMKAEEVKALIIGIREANLSDTFKNIHVEISENTDSTQPAKKATSFIRRGWWAAAAILIFAAAGFWWKIFLTPAHRQLYNNHFVADIGLPVEMSNTDTSRYLLYDGMISYKENDYVTALRKWQEAEKGMGSNDTLQYYSALALMELEQFEEAEAHLLSVASRPESAFYKKSIWYLALCTIAQNNLPAAKELLNRLPENEQAQLLLKKLE